MTTSTPEALSNDAADLVKEEDLPTGVCEPEGLYVEERMSIKKAIYLDTEYKNKNWCLIWR
ncbi:hypothetical protein KAW18_11920 [candidate division WOR-3 bacterium]|nr:hypothetical protein [candidate division WOR-3 bacterium]